MSGDYERGKAKGKMLNATVRNDREDTVIGQRGILALALDLNHNLVLSDPARTGKGNPSQLGWSFIPQDVGGEMVMRRNCPEIGGGARGGGRGSAYCGFCMGASGEREFCRLGSRRNSRLGNLRYAWRNVVHPGRKPPRGMPESDSGFVLEDIGG